MALDPTVLTTDHAEEGLTTDEVDTLHSHQRALLRAEADDLLARLARKRDELVASYPIELDHLNTVIDEATAARRELD
jgi:hypothetical protein